MKLLYISNARIPTEMAHGLQIMQNCEAFADAGVDLTLWCAQRRPQVQADPWQYYGIRRNFTLYRLPTLDLTRGTTASALFFYVQLATFTLSVVIRALFTQADIYYSRDPLVLLALSFIKPRRTLAYEAHRFNEPGRGRWLQRTLLQRVGSTIAITPPLAERLQSLQTGSARQSRMMVAHDGIRRARFENPMTQQAARTILNWPADAFIAGYVVRLQTMGMDKGVNFIIDAVKTMPEPVTLALVGGPGDLVEVYREQWRAAGLPENRFIATGQVPSERVPLHLFAFDICLMPLPRTEHFAFNASPIKLFEYMASGRALIASDLPSWADVIQHGENALLFAPSDVEGLQQQVRRLYHDADERQRLARHAQGRVMLHYTWEARAAAILRHVRQSLEAESVRSPNNSGT